MGVPRSVSAAMAPAATLGLLLAAGLVAGELGGAAWAGDAPEGDAARVYPEAIGTRVDDCQACHRGGEIVRSGGRTTVLNPCSYCHLIDYPDAEVERGGPGDYAGTLNPYGLTYRDAGRSLEAVRAVGALDSDCDGHANEIEIRAARYPGDPGSHPGQQVIPLRTLTREEIAAMPQHDQLVLLNAHRQKFDQYVVYRGPRMIDLLEAAGVPLTPATTITCFAPDGYAVDFTHEQITRPYPQGVYYPHLDPGSFADPEQGFVTYPPAELIPAGLDAPGELIPEAPWLQVASGRDGGLLDPSYLDVATGHQDGEGPFRLIAPQSRPGEPDRGLKHSPSGFDDGHDFDPTKDNNAGLCVRGLVAIRVNPMPQGFEEFDWKNGGHGLIESRGLIVYGAGVDGR